MTDIQGVAADRLRSFIERVERLEAEKADLSADIKEVYAEAKGAGFDTKTMRNVVKLRKLDEADRREQEELLNLYMGALDGTPLGDFAKKIASGEVTVTVGEGSKAA